MATCAIEEDTRLKVVIRGTRCSIVSPKDASGRLRLDQQFIYGFVKLRVGDLCVAC